MRTVVIDLKKVKVYTDCVIYHEPTFNLTFKYNKIFQVIYVTCNNCPVDYFILYLGIFKAYLKSENLPLC